MSRDVDTAARLAEATMWGHPDGPFVALDNAMRAVGLDPDDKADRGRLVAAIRDAMSRPEYLERTRAQVSRLMAEDAS